jgi:signal transduction histidine kinase
MSGALKLRLLGFISAIGLMVILIAWTAHSSWTRAGELREKLNAVQLESFRIADHFQQSILELNNLVQRYGTYRDRADWQRFAVGSTNLDKWIDDQRPILKSEHEKEILDQINSTYDNYLAEAWQIEARVRTSSQPTPRLGDFSDFEKQSQRLLNLSFDLARAHRESLDEFLADSKKSLNYLRFRLLISLTLLLLSGGGLAYVVYRELIAPLRVKLVESQTLVERQEKLASLGMLAAGMAHEIRNPLTAIKAWLFLQQKHLQHGSIEHEDARIISDEIDRLERIVKDVLLFARPSAPELRTIPAGQPLREVQMLMSPQFRRRNIQVELDQLTAAHVLADLQQIKQVLINFVQNAADSIGHDGTITLRARRDMKRLRDKTVDAVILEVSDTGKGIPSDVEKRLFDPFFTTKEAGTGLGLSIAARIVEKHGGALQYQTQINRGTTFGIVLPEVIEAHPNGSDSS